MAIEIRYFRTARGDEPVRDYIQELPTKERAKIEGRFSALGMTGKLEMPHGSKLAGYQDLFEVRSGRHRILYAFHGGEVVLLGAFIKKSRETPKGEIELAQRRLWNYVNMGG